MYSTPMVDVDVFWARIFDNENGGGCTRSTFGAGTTPASGANCAGVIFPGAGTRGTSDQDIYGAYVTLKVVPNWTIEPYYFLLQDTRPSAGDIFATPQAADQTRSTLGGRINGKAAGLDATGELAWQFGGASSSAASQAHNLHINAWAGAFRAGYTFEPV